MRGDDDHGFTFTGPVRARQNKAHQPLRLFQNGAQPPVVAPVGPVGEDRVLRERGGAIAMDRIRPAVELAVLSVRVA